LTTPKDVANYLCEYFSSEGAKLCWNDAWKRIKQPPKIVQWEIPVENQLVYNAFTLNEVSKFISRMQSNSNGVDGISLKITKSVLTPVVSNLINKSMEKFSIENFTGNFPGSFVGC